MGQRQAKPLIPLNLVFGQTLSNLSDVDIRFQYIEDQGNDWSYPFSIQNGRHRYLGGGVFGENLIGLRIIEPERSYHITKVGLRQLREICDMNWWEARFSPQECYLVYLGDGRLRMYDTIPENIRGAADF